MTLAFCGVFGAMNTKPCSNRGTIKRDTQRTTPQRTRLQTTTTTQQQQPSQQQQYQPSTRQHSTSSTSSSGTSSSSSSRQRRADGLRDHAVTARSPSHLLAAPLLSWRGLAAAAASPPRCTPLFLSRTPMPAIFQYEWGTTVERIDRVREHVPG